MPKAKTISVRVPEALHDELTAIASGERFGAARERLGTVASHLLADAAAQFNGLEETPPEWRIKGIGEWERQKGAPD